MYLSEKFFDVQDGSLSFFGQFAKYSIYYSYLYARVFARNFSRLCNLNVRGRRENIYSTLYVYTSKMFYVTLFGDNPFKSCLHGNKFEHRVDVFLVLKHPLFFIA